MCQSCQAPSSAGCVHITAEQQPAYQVKSALLLPIIILILQFWNVCGACVCVCTCSCRSTFSAVWVLLSNTSNWKVFLHLQKVLKNHQTKGVKNVSKKLLLYIWWPDQTFIKSLISIIRLTMITEAVRYWEKKNRFLPDNLWKESIIPGQQNDFVGCILVHFIKQPI